MQRMPGLAPGCAPCPQAAGAAAERMKPQEIANTCWAWATMRHFPGAATMDAMLAHAGGASVERRRRGQGWQAAKACGQASPARDAATRVYPLTLPGLAPPAEAQLERFKSQELGMLTWAAAKLGYMPAARLVRAALPHMAAARAPAVQVRVA